MFSSDGNEIYIVPARAYVRVLAREKLSFWDVSVRARSLGDLLIGFRVGDQVRQRRNRFWGPGSSKKKSISVTWFVKEENDSRTRLVKEETDSGAMFVK